jgi:hypothetical protein
MLTPRGLCREQYQAELRSAQVCRLKAVALEENDWSWVLVRLSVPLPQTLITYLILDEPYE